MADGDGTRRTVKRRPFVVSAALFCAAAAYALLDGTYLLALCYSSIVACNVLFVARADEPVGPSSALVWALIGAAAVSFVAHVAL